MMVSAFLLLFVNIVVLAVNDQIQKIYDDRTALPSCGFKKRKPM